MPLDANRVKSLFLEALERSTPEQWPAYLDQACTGEPELRHRVAVLLQAHLEAGSALDRPDTESAATREQALLREGPGTAIGPYKLLEQLGEGGMGAVFLAEQARPVQRRVALKIIKPGMDSKQVSARFEAERQALALMDHPHIAKVHDAGTTDTGRPYFVMELVKGVPITRYCDEHHLTPRQRLELFVPVCQAVQHAHQKGIIHRELKPSNVLVALYDGRPVPKVIDFGVAKAAGPRLTDKTLFTEFGQVVGTLEYMSPEQAELNQLDIDTRSDIYSLGVLLYELLTGTTPLERQRLNGTALLEALRLIREEEPPRPSTRLSAAETLPAIAAHRGLEPRRLRGLLRGELDWVVMKCLEKDRDRRYETANGLARDLQRYLADEPVLACPPSAGYRLRKFARRHTAALTAAGLVAAVLVLSTLVSAWLAVRATEAEGLAAARLRTEAEARQEADAARGRAVRERDQAQRRLFEARLAQAQASRWSGRVGQRFASWEALTEAAQIARDLKLDEGQRLRLRNEAIACLARADAKLLKEWPGCPAGTGYDVSFDGDLARYARCDTQGNISVRRVADDHELARLAGGPRHSQLWLSPDGDFLVEINRTLRVWDWRRGAVVLQHPWAEAVRAAFTADGRRLAVSQADGTITLFEVGTWKALKRLSVDFKVVSVAIHPDGARLAAGGLQGQVEVRDLGTGRLRCRRDYPGTVDVAWHPGGVLLAVACSDSQVYLWNVATDRPHAVLHGHRGNVVRVAFSADGDFLLSESWDGTGRIWDPWSGSQLLVLESSRWLSRTGSRLVTRSSENLNLWEVSLGREYLTLPGAKRATGYTEGLAVSPDGRWLAVATNNGVEFRDLAAGPVRAFLPVGYTQASVFHPSGRELITCGAAGVHAWPLRGDGQSLRIGPPRRLARGSFVQCALDGQGRRLAVLETRRGQGQILDLENPSAKGIAFRHAGANFVTVSPDGRWVVSAPWGGDGVRVWEAHSGRFVRQLLPEQESASALFSPDGRWLVTGTWDGIDLWDVTSWRRVWRVSREREATGMGRMAFSSDGKVLALGWARGAVQLVDPATGRPFARLQAPPSDWLSCFRFTPDGSRLVALASVGTAQQALRVWNLRRIRERLREIRLDWDLPPYPPAAAPAGAEPVRVELDLGELAATKK
jgi:serine/threonine protein kinase/WD40 repeat protein